MANEKKDKAQRKLLSKLMANGGNINLEQAMEICANVYRYSPHKSASCRASELLADLETSGAIACEYDRNGNVITARLKNIAKYRRPL